VELIMATNARPIPSPAAREDAPRLSVHSPAASSRPWYRTEPWIVPTLGAFLPMVAGLALEIEMVRPLLLLSALLLLLGAGMLLRQGVFRSADTPGPRR
jgi:hypothetical protein